MIKQIREIIRGFEEDEGPAALYARLDRLKAFLTAYEEPPTETDEDPIVPGSVVQLKSGGSTMTVLSVKTNERFPDGHNPEDKVSVAWLQDDGVMEGEVVTRVALKHHKPEPGHY